jgi:hypothetical protein
MRIFSYKKYSAFFLHNIISSDNIPQNRTEGAESYEKIPTFAPRKSGYSAVRLAHLLWEQGVAGSNPATPTKEN